MTISASEMQKRALGERSIVLPRAAVIPGVIGEVEVEVPGVITQCPLLDHVQIQQKLINRKSEGIVRP